MWAAVAVMRARREVEASGQRLPRGLEQVVRDGGGLGGPHVEGAGVRAGAGGAEAIATLEA